jgi:ferredoxin-NADP reductase
MFIDPYRWQTVRILSVIHESADAVTLITERPSDYNFMPGQHAILRVTLLDSTTRLRQYSFAENPEKNSLYFTITRSPGGDVSNWSIEHASIKSTIDISQAFTGPLQVDLRSYNRIGMIGGGSGIVPLTAHLRHMRAQKSTQKVRMLYTTKSTKRCYEHELVNSNDLEQIDVRLTDKEDRYTSDEIVSSISDCDIVLVCGSREFVTHVQDTIHTLLPNLTVRAEAFSLQ